MFTTLLSAIVIVGGLAQDQPADLNKTELPKKGICAVCSLTGSHSGEEPIVAGVRYKGAVYLFCNRKELDEFKKDPEQWIPLPLPRPAPQATFELANGDKLTLDSLKGKVVLVDFWATWCKVCRDSMPQIEKIASTYSEKGLVVLAPSIDEKKADFSKFVAKRSSSMKMVWDGTQPFAWERFRVRALPSYFLIDKQGRIVVQWVGKVDKDKLEAAIRVELAR